MQDMLIQSDAGGVYDIQIDGADFASAMGFETAIPVSLFTDSRAPAVQVQDSKNRRGWVGNIRTIDIERELGGLLWILDQSRITSDTLNFARSYAQDSLQWLLDDGLARGVEVAVDKPTDRGIRVRIAITTIDNTVTRYIALWRATDLNRTLST